MKQTQGTQIRNIIQSLGTFIRTSGPIPEIKNMYWSKIKKILGRIKAKQGVGEVVWSVPNTAGESGGGTNPKTFLRKVFTFI